MKNIYNLNQILRAKSMLPVILLFAVSLIGMPKAQSQCDHEIVMYDTYGDGWNGGKLTVYLDGVAILTDITMTSRPGPESVFFTAESGQEITTTFVCGSWCMECWYEIHNVNCGVIAIDGKIGNQQTSPKGIQPGTCFSNCDNHAPVALCQNVTVNGNEYCEAIVTPVQVDNGSYDPDGDPIILSLDPSGPYQLGETTVTLTVEDNCGETDQCTAIITVEDDDPPVILTTTAAMNFEIWPPNHKYETFTVEDFVMSVGDNCTEVSIIDVFIVRATSDEPEDAEGDGDGSTLEDIVIAADCQSVQLRKEREGTGNGRVYTVFFELVDETGNIGYATSNVQVPHNIGETAIDDGMAYEVECGNKSFSITTKENSESDFELINYPNPFTTSTTFIYSLEKNTTVIIQIFNTQGQLMEKIEQEQQKGEQKIQWNAEGWPSGMYFFRIQAGSSIANGKLILQE